MTLKSSRFRIFEFRVLASYVCDLYTYNLIDKVHIIDPKARSYSLLKPLFSKETISNGFRTHFYWAIYHYIDYRMCLVILKLVEIVKNL